MKEKLRKLFQGNREDRIIACNLLVENYGVYTFLRDWIKEDSSIYKFKAAELKRIGVLFVPETEIENSPEDFYYQYGSQRWLLCTSQELVICYATYYSRIEIIKHEK